MASLKFDRLVQVNICRSGQPETPDTPTMISINHPKKTLTMRLAALRETDKS
jgi:hypothetical protein